jgi:hypothetical protein
MIPPIRSGARGLYPDADFLFGELGLDDFTGADEAERALVCVALFLAADPVVLERRPSCRPLRLG